ncbi:interleukin-6 receptor subunit beta isoform X2 [Paralichthys olivaceus]
MNSCTVTPKDLYIELGSDTVVDCKTSCVSGKIFWTLNNKRIDERLSKTINTSLTILSLTNFTQQRAMLQCHSANTEQVLGGTFISTYTKPSKISCKLHYKTLSEGVPQLFTCNWQHKINYSQGINYTVFVSSSSDSMSEMCSSHKTRCTSTNISGKIYLTSYFNVTVRATTNAWKTYSDPQEFYPYSILEIVPPKINVSVKSANNVSIQWKRSAARSREDINCEVKYTETVGNKTPEVLSHILKPGENGNVSKKLNICTKYNVSVRCALKSAPWSEWSPEKEVLTELNKSDVKLHLWRTVTKPDTNGIRKVHAMWMPIPATCDGTFTYAVRQIPYKQHTTGVNYTETLCSNSTCNVEVNEDEHRINLRVFNHETLFAEDSVYVPATAGSLRHVTEIQTSAVDGVVLVSWTPPVQPVRGYMIDWTHDGKQYYWNESKYTNTSLFGMNSGDSWVRTLLEVYLSHMNNTAGDSPLIRVHNSTEMSVSVFYMNDLLDKKQYNITVTPLFDDKTGHGSQAVQICSRIGDPANITIDSVRANDRSATVSWITKSQEECSGAVINYTVFCSTQEGPTLNVTVDSTKRDVFLKDLNPNTQYSIYVEATASTGTSKSRESLFKTKTFDPRMIKVLSVSGSIVIILLLSLGICCTIQWKKFKEKPVPDPGHSSLALWLLPDHQKGMCLFQAFSNPSESFCDRVYTEEMQKKPARPSARGHNPAFDEAEEYYIPTAARTPNLQIDKPDEHVETHLCLSEESTELLSMRNKPGSPYRSQSSVEKPDQRTDKLSMRFPVKQPEKKPLMTVYVTLNMLKEGPLRETESNSKIQECIRSE